MTQPEQALSDDIPALVPDDDIRLLVDSPAPTPVFAAPRPLWLDTLSNWRTFAALDRTRPDLADSPPPGAAVSDNDLRLRYHALMPTVVTPAIGRALVVVHQHLLSNRERTHGKPGVIIEGPRGTGKTEILQYIGRYYENKIARLYEPDENRVPVIALRVPPLTRGGRRNWSASFAFFLGLKHDGGTDPTRSVCHVMRHSSTLLVLVDGIEQLRAGADAEESFAYLEEISEKTGATFVFAGRAARSIVDPLTRDRETALADHEEIWGDYASLRTRRIGYDDEGRELFAKIVREFDKRLCLHRHQPDDLTNLHEYLHRRSKGYMRALSQLVSQGAQKAIWEKKERITEDLLETLTIGRSRTI
ncbi:AAA family ATPase [Streptomyces sp. NPDC014846]|uniref:AAA family ATPase n=1 Tax=Streptomyces sp. NPDC014846 TaxID=3364922 RepID=UPI0036FCA806